MPTNEPTRIIRSSGNVYADLGFDDPDLELAKAQLAMRLGAIIEERGLTQVAAAEILGIDQPKVSAITRGRLGDFSVERLMHLLVKLDQTVEISVTPSEQGGRLIANVPSAPNSPMAAESRSKRRGAQFS